MNNQTVYWLWIQNVLGFASIKLDMIAENYTFAEDFYRSPLPEKLSLGCFAGQDVVRLKNDSLSSAYSLMQRCEKAGVDIISYGDEAYPELLRYIKAPPAVLFVRGNTSALSEELNIAIVGTRSATIMGSRNASSLAHDLASAGVCIVSGGAVGIDTQAHVGALRANGKTVCVLGCGHECGYLREFDHIKRDILQRGAVISEYPPDMKPSKFTFPQRNRIISGISNGVLVIEAGRRSGSLITVNTALEQGRDVFAVPGDISSSVSFGTNDMIRDGAIPVTKAADVLDEYPHFGKPKKRKRTEHSFPEQKKQVNTHDAVYEQLPLKIEKPGNDVPVEDDVSEIPVKMDFSAYIGKKLITDRNTAEYPLKSPAESKEDSGGASVIKKKTKQTQSNSSSNITDKTEIKQTISSSSAPEPEITPEASATVNDAPQQPDDVTPEVYDELSDEAVAFLKALGSEVLHIDEIAERTKMPISAVHAAATELEMNDLIESLQGRRYKRI